MNSEKAVKSVSVLILFAFVGKFLGFIREALIAAKFGSGMEADAYFVAFTATGLFTAFLTQAIRTTMIPVLSEIERKEGKYGKIIHVNNLFNVILVVAFIVTLITWIFAPYVIKIIAIGFEEEQYDLAVLLMRIGSPVIIFSCIVGVYRGFLQSELKFNESAIADSSINLVFIVFLIIFANLYGIKGLMIASVISVASQILLQIPGLKKAKYKYLLKFDITDTYVKKIMLMTSPVLLSVAVNDLNKIVDRSLASTLAIGSISALNYGNKLKTLILGIFITAITTVIFPMLSKTANSEDLLPFKNTVVKGINIILIITVPATIGLIVFAEPIIELVFQRGAFDVRATQMTSSAMIFYSLGLTGTALRTLMNRAYYSLQDTKTPMYNGFIAVGVNIALNLILIQVLDFRGLALATSISATLTTLLLINGLRKKIGSLGLNKSMKCIIITFFSSLVMAIISRISYSAILGVTSNFRLSNIFSLLVAIFVGFIIYCGSLYIFKLEEIKWFISLMKKKRKGSFN
jgi:putative peptidoglycan lipid II flippase